MWYLVINKESKRYFIKMKDNYNIYFVKEDENKILITNITELQRQNFRIVGLAHEFENAKLEMLLEEKLEE